MNIICWLKGHKRIKTLRTSYNHSRPGDKYTYYIECGRCGFTTSYTSPLARLVGKEMQKGFTGE